MTTRSIASKSLRIVYPSELVSSIARPESVDRDLGDPWREPLLSALADAGMQTLEEFRLAPKLRPRSARSSSVDPAMKATTVSLDVAGDEGAVILVDREGLYSWRFPEVESVQVPRTAHRASERPGGSRTLTFVLPGPERETPLPSASLGSCAESVPGVLRAVVMKFAAPRVAGHAMAFIEREVQRGLVAITDPDPLSWHPVDTIDAVHLPSDRAARVLLFVPGTFSSTLATFGGLGCTDGGRTFLTEALSSYDAVLGFDHPTLSVDPLANATDLLRRLTMHHGSVVFDIVSHSRGGLVSRSFAEHVLPDSGWSGRVDRLVLTAAPNGGTSLASPERWNDLLEVITNLTAVGAAVMARLPGGPPVSAVVTRVVKGIVAFVKYLGAYALADGGVPGLAAMAPGSPYLTALNAFRAGQPAPGTPWFVVSSDFHVTLFDDHHNPPEFPKELARKLADGILAPVFRCANDLVVDSKSMVALAGPNGGYVADTLDFGTNDIVYHGNYFLQPAFTEAISRWLLKPLNRSPESPLDGAGVADLCDGWPSWAVEASVDKVHADEVGGSELDLSVEGDVYVSTQGGGMDGFDIVAASSRRDRCGLPLAVREKAGRSPAPGGHTREPQLPVPVPAHLLAEMPSAPLVDERAQVRVALSRHVIEPLSAHDAHADATILALPGRELTAHVVGKLNAVVDGKSTDVFSLPPGDGTSEVLFHVIPQSIGPVVVLVDIRDGVVPLAMLTVKAEAVATVSEAGPQASTTTDTVADTDTPDLVNTFWLEIHETQPGAHTVFEYTVRAPHLGLLETYTSLPLRDRQGYVTALFRDVARLYDDYGPGRAFTSGLQDRGAQLFDELFPRELQELLWEHRNHLDNLLLLADEPFIPWELVHLKPPMGPRTKESLFLGQLGLVRWQFAGFPRRTLRARCGKVWSLCPEYPDSPSVLVASSAEARYLRKHFLARTATGTEAGLTKLLHRGGFDLLHFSGHGFCDPADVQTARIVLTGKVGAGGVVTPRYLTTTTVTQNARLRAADGSGPLIVVNACQTGRGGQLLSSFGGFAKAFLDAGAAAYISTLWSVREIPARDFVETLYDHLLAGETMVVATKAAREAARAAGDATWLAYVVYARPDARLITD